MSTEPRADSRPVVVYDGECRFCRNQVEKIQRKDRSGIFEYAARQTPGLEQRFPYLAEGDFDTGMRLIEPEGSIFVGSDAVYQIARRLSGWRTLAWLYRVPGLHFLFRRAYAWVAANRSVLGGQCREDPCAAEHPTDKS